MSSSTDTTDWDITYHREKQMDLVARVIIIPMARSSEAVVTQTTSNHLHAGDTGGRRTNPVPDMDMNTYTQHIATKTSPIPPLKSKGTGGHIHFMRPSKALNNFSPQRGKGR